MPQCDNATMRRRLVELRGTKWLNEWRCQTDRLLGSGTAIGNATMPQCDNATMRRRLMELRGTKWLNEWRCQTDRLLGSGTAIGNAAMRQCHNEEAIDGAARDEMAERMAVPNGPAPGKWYDDRECDDAAMRQCSMVMWCRSGCRIWGADVACCRSVPLRRQISGVARTAAEPVGEWESNLGRQQEI